MKISADLKAETYPADAPEDAVLIYRAESLLLRFSRYGSQEYLKIACAMAPGQFYWFGDIEVAMGWRSLEKVLSCADLPPLPDVINRLAQHLVELKKSFFKSTELFTQSTIQRTMRGGALRLKPDANFIAVRRGSASSGTGEAP